VTKSSRDSFDMAHVVYRDTMTVDPDLVYEAILGLRRGGKAVVLLTYRGDW
jgi:hypothetical protein